MHCHDTPLLAPLDLTEPFRPVAESPSEVARRIERAERILGAGRVRYIHPDCGFWMLKRGIADAKIRVLAQGRDLFEGLGV